MKHLLILIFIVANISIYSKDSTEIKFEYVKDIKQKLANNLNGIKMISIVCEDTLMRGKTFKLIMEEYEKGELIKTDDFGLTCEDEEHEFEMNGEQYVHVYNACDAVRFKKEDERYEIHVAMQQQESTTDAIFKINKLERKKKLKSNKMYSLRVMNKTNNKYMIPVGEATPILAYNPPYEIDENMSWYCILDTENPGKWYSDYDIEHFYIVYLLIE
ncbi:MAG: hypothetical protein ACE364_06425 [Chlorobiota bacterium]